MKSKLPALISFCVLILAMFIKHMDYKIIRDLQYKVFDNFQTSHPREFVPQPVVIVDIDDASLEKLGQWPWPRNILANIVTKLNEGGAAAIGFDIVFAEEDRTSPKNILPLWGKSDKLGHLIDELPDHDNLLRDSIESANVVTGFALSSGDATKKSPQAKAGFSFAGVDPKPYLTSFSGGVPSIKVLENVARGNGALNSIPDDDGIIRRVPTIITENGQFYPSLAMELLRIAQGASSYVIKSTGASDEPNTNPSANAVTSIKVGQFTIPTDNEGKLMVYYTGHKAERFFPAWKILEPDFDAKQFEGYIVLIGTSAAGLKDIRATPFEPTTAGVEVHAEVIEQVLSGQFLYRPDFILVVEMAIMFVVGILLIIMMTYLPALLGALFAALTVIVTWFGSLQLFTVKHIYVDYVTPVIAIGLVFVSESLMRYIISEREKKQVRNAFSHYMSPDLVAQLAKDPKSLKLGGEIKNLTMLFCDIRGFTTISEGLTAEELTSFINKFLTPMTNIILGHKGTIDKYMGDCIMAFWNAPLNDENHPTNAAISALGMITELKQLNIRQQEFAQQNNRKFIPINIGIGLNTGDACVGNMGSDQRFDYSVLGDDVNLASRLEGQSKHYGVSIVIGEKTQERLEGFATLELDLIKVKGKNKPVRIYTLLGDRALADNEDYKNLHRNFMQMLEAYRAKQWKEASKSLEASKAIASRLDGISISGLFELYEERISDFQNNPPPEDWDGVYTATEK